MADGRQVEKQTVEFEAGRGAHPFLLGDDLYDVLLKLRGLIRFFRDIDVRFDESDPLGFPILVCLVDAGLNLVFEAMTQALVRIEKFEPGAQRAQERNKRLRFTQMAGAGDLALVDFVGLPTSESGGRSERYRDVARVYRAAHAVRYDAAKEALFLVYPGISFVFDVRSDNVSRYTADPNALPGDHENYSRAIIEALPGEAAPAPRNLVQICGDGLIFDGDAERCICFGDPVQEVLSQLGEPDDIYSPEEHPASQLYRILNYFSRGLDVVTFADTHTVAKFVLHTNLPTHPDFGHYSKATFCMQEDDSLTANVRFADFQESQVFDFEEPIAARYTVANGPNDDPDARSYLHYNIYKAPTRGIHFEVDALSGLVATVTFHPVEGLQG